MYLISVYFDEKTDQRIRNLMEQAAKRSGNTYMIDAKVPPHITISAFETRREAEAAEMLKCVAEGMKSGTLLWASAGAFFPGVIYLAPVLNAYLQEQFGVFSGEIVKIGLARTNPYEDLICVELNE